MIAFLLGLLFVGWLVDSGSKSASECYCYTCLNKSPRNREEDRGVCRPCMNEGLTIEIGDRTETAELCIDYGTQIGTHGCFKILHNELPCRCRCNKRYMDYRRSDGWV